MIHRWYYSEINEELYEIKKGSITRHFTNEEKYQTYSPNIDSKEKYNSLLEDLILITKRERERERKRERERERMNRVQN